MYMNVTTENIILVSSILLIISILANKTSFRFGIPTLLLFLLVGMLAGSDGIGKIKFDDPSIAQFLGVIALNFILFSGGMDTKWVSIKPIVWRGVVLSTFGVIITAGTLGAFVYWLTDFTLLESFLLGSIVSSTDAAAVFAILRTQKVGLKENLRPTLELESGSNDPMAYVLTISFIYLITQGNASAFDVVLLFFQQMILGAVLGYVLGRLSIYIINNINLDTEGLYPVLMMAIIFFIFSFTDFLGGNGFLAVYLSAIIIGNGNLIHKKSLLKFYDGQAWLMQIVMFLTLGLLVYPTQLLPIAGTGLLISAILVFIARPVSVFICLAYFKVSTRKKLFISWVGLRGAVPIVFATYPLLAGVDKASSIFHLVFFISVTSVLVQGSTLTRVAKWLKQTVPARVKRKTALDMELSDSIKSELFEVIIPPKSAAVDKPIVSLNFPKNAFIVLLNRHGKYIQPTGSTHIEAGDELLIMATDKEAFPAIYKSLGLTFIGIEE